ncbi:TetR/AcrR family transcriptional regulator [Schaalia suimastitidis]|uniref:TetR/AcrR family transcriptional regulator n=1 Tax=Schaalia suimastitidis TaxID=121163 RepID=UPI000686752F|nr:TetR family transcriptional regulator [Schaalia suimastitidis]
MTIRAAETTEMSVTMAQAQGVRRGPRQDRSDLKEVILDAAGECFAANGFQQTTMRSIAQRAGTNAKLIHYYFGSKAELFAAGLERAFAQTELPVLLAQANMQPKGFGQRYLKAILTIMEDPQRGAAFLSLLRSMGTHDESRLAFNDFIMRRIVSLATTPAQTVRIALMGSQLLGVLYTRYVAKVNRLADMSVDSVAALIGPTLDHYLTMDIPAELLSESSQLGGPAS